MEIHFPVKTILTSVSLQSILFGIQFNIFSNATKGDKNKSSFIIDVLSLVIISIAIFYTDKFKLEGRKGYFFKNSLTLVRATQAGCFFISSIYFFSDGFFAAIVGFVILIVQNVCKLNILTTILSIIYIQNLEVGFYFGLQFLVFEISLVFGSLLYFAFDSQLSLFICYIFLIICFVVASHRVHESLSEDHEEVDSHTWRLWLDIVKVRAFSLLNIVTQLLIIVSMLTTYPLGLYLIYKYLRPIQNKAFIVFGLVFQSLSLMFLMLVYADKGKNTELIAVASPILSQIGLVFVTVSALPDMIKSTIEEVPNVESGVLTDRVCSLAYAAFYFGKVIIQVFTSVLRELMSFELGMILASLFILLFAAVYEYFGYGVRNFKIGKVEGDSVEIDLKEYQNEKVLDG